MRCHSRSRAALLVLAVTFVPLVHAQQDSSAARVVIRVDSLDRARFANVGELLQARVPGLTITRNGDGALHWYMRGQGSVSGSAPLVLVDDVRLTLFGPLLPELGVYPSRLDDIDIENVERVEILSGPATSAAYGTGAGNGLIHVHTFAPRAQETAWRLFTSAGMIDDDVSYPAIYQREGTQGPFTTQQCTLVLEARGSCTPTGPVTAFNPLETESPFERALAARVGGAVATMTGPIAWRAGATFDREGSTSGRLASQRLHLHGGASMSPTSSTGATLRAFWTRGDADLAPDVQSLLGQGILPINPAVWSGFRRPPYPDYGSERYGVAAGARWQLAHWLDSHLTVGSEWSSGDDDGERVEPGSTPPRTETRHGERRSREFNARARFSATYSARGVGGVSTLTLERAEARNEEELSTVERVGPDTAAAAFVSSNGKTDISGVDVTQRLDLWGRATLTGGVRLDRVNVGETQWGTSPYPHMSFSWDVRQFTPAVFGGVRLRAALGDVGNLPQTRAAFFVREKPQVETTHEREVGIDLEAANRRLGVSATWYTRRTTDVEAIFQLQFPQFVTLEVLNRGIEGVLRGKVVATRRVAADLVLRYAYNHNEVRRSERAQFPVLQTGLHRQVAAVSAPLGAHLYAEVARLEDLDGDGLFDDACPVNVGGCEVLVTPVELRPAFPPTVASLETTVRIGSVTIAALFDHRGGHYRANTTEAVRCMYVCRGAYDDRAPALEQARVVASYSEFPAVYVEDASFIKLRELSLRFTAPARWAEAFGASQLEFSLAGRNVVTWTDYSGLDPEAMSMPWIPLASRDAVATPIPRRFSLRVTAVRE